MPPTAESEATAGATAAPPPADVQPQAALSACDLLTPEEIARVAGFAVGPGRITATGNLSHCAWSRLEGTEGGISVTLYDGAQAEGVFASYEEMKGGRPVPGVAGDAIWNADQGGLMIRKGERTVNVTFLYKPVGEEAANALARLVAERI